MGPVRIVDDADPGVGAGKLNSSRRKPRFIRGVRDYTCGAAYDPVGDDGLVTGRFEVDDVCGDEIGLNAALRGGIEGVDVGDAAITPKGGGLVGAAEEDGTGESGA